MSPHEIMTNKNNNRGAIKKTWAETKSEKQWKKTKRKQIHLTDRGRRTEPWRSPRQVYNLLEADTIGPSLEKLLTVWITTPAIGKREREKGKWVSRGTRTKELAKFAGNIKYLTQNICFVLIFIIIINRHMLDYIENQLKAKREVKSAEKQWATCFAKP